MIKVETFIVGSLETNCYLVYSDKSKTGFLIDPGFFDKRISDIINQKGISVKNIINTHGHIDHIAGNKKFGYPVLIHEKDKSFLTNPMKNLSLFTGVVSSSHPAAGLLKDKDKIEADDITFEVIHTPGHTPGGISLKLEKMLFTGDALFRESIGRTDFPYGSEKNLLDSIKNRLMVFPDDVRVFPGHGPVSTIGHERRNNPFLAD